MSAVLEFANVERRTQTLLALPIPRWMLVVGKLIGIQTLSSISLITGYLVSASLASRQGLSLTPYSHYGLATALTASFACLCVSVPLGGWLPSMAAGTVTVVVLMLRSTLELLVDKEFLIQNWLLRVTGYLFPWSIPAEPMDYAFYDSVRYPDLVTDYPALAWNVVFALVFLGGLTFLLRRAELSR